MDKEIISNINYILLGIIIISKCIIVGTFSAFLGIFYRNCIKFSNNMVLAPLYRLLKKMENKGGFYKWLSFPIGYCIYCSTTWITIIAYFLIIKEFSLLFFIPFSLQHIIIMYYDKHYLNLPEFNKTK